MSLCCPHRLLAWGESVVLGCQTMAVAVLGHVLVAFKVEHEGLGSLGGDMVTHARLCDSNGIRDVWAVACGVWCDDVGCTGHGLVWVLVCTLPGLWCSQVAWLVLVFVL